MPTTLRRCSALVAVAVAVCSGWWWNARQSQAAMQKATAAAVLAAAAEANIRSRDIAFYEQRIVNDPASALNRIRLAELLLQRARAQNDYQDFLRAEQVARASLVQRTKRNSAPYAVLASSLLAQHRFLEARDAARSLVAAEPDEDSYSALLGETCLEVGDYEGARAAFARITPVGRASLAVTPRLARWAELRGDTATARRLMQSALNTARETVEMPREQAAWFFLRAADVDSRQGSARRAEATLHEGLLRNPGDHRLLAAMARLRVERRDWQGAIQYGDSAISIALDPATLGTVSDAYRALGDTAKAAQYFTAMEVAVGAQPGLYHRAWSLYLLDHGQRVPEVLAAAQAEIAARPDVYGYDLLAWALFKGGRVTEARAAMRSALALGTIDPALRNHALAIERAGLLTAEP